MVLVIFSKINQRECSVRHLSFVQFKFFQVSYFLILKYALQIKNFYLHATSMGQIQLILCNSHLKITHVVSIHTIVLDALILANEAIMLHCACLPHFAIQVLSKFSFK